MSLRSWPRAGDGVGNQRVLMHMQGMSQDHGTHPYTLEALPCDTPAGHFRWVIRKHGKLIERSERLYPSGQSAREEGQAALERQFRSER